MGVLRTFAWTLCRRRGRWHKLSPALGVLSLFALSGCPYYDGFVSIYREYETEFERDLIDHAETLCPNRDAVLEIFQESLIGTIPPDDECLWWYRRVGDVRWPFAVTRDAIEYYSRRVTSDADDGGLIPSPERLDYHASVSFESEIVIDEKQFENVYLVSLELFVDVNGGASLSKTRSVVFSEAGEVLFVFGDGPTPVVVP